MQCLSHMVKTTYTTEQQKFDLLTDTINYIWNNIDPKLTENEPITTREYFKSDNFSHFKSEIESARRIYKNSSDIHQTEHVLKDLHLWEFGLQFAIPPGKEKAYAPGKFKKFGANLTTLPGEYLSNRVILLRQIIDLLNHHFDDVWTKDDDQGRDKLYNTPPHNHFIKHEHVTKRPHKTKEPDPVDVESTESKHLDALLLQLHVLSERDI